MRPRDPSFSASRLTLRRSLAAAAVAALLSTTAAAQSFEWLPHAAGLENSAALALSADGTAVVGYSYTGSTRVGFRWRSIDGLTPIGEVATAVSADGSVVVGYGMSTAFKWSVPTGFLPLGELDGGATAATAVSGDGYEVFGIGSPMTGVRSFRWDPMSGMEDLGFPPPNQAKAVSADGSALAGDADDLGGTLFRWTPGGGYQTLGNVPGASGPPFATNISDDGNLIVGYNGKPIRWTPATGVEEIEPEYGAAFAIAPDLSMIGGSTESPSQQAVLWFSDGSRISAAGFLETQGLCPRHRPISTR